METITPLFRSEKTLGIFELLADLRFHTAAEIAAYTGIEDSREVYPRLKRWASLIDIRKVGVRKNIYKLKDRVVDAVKKGLKISTKAEKVLKKAEKVMKKTMGRELTDEERAVLEFLINYYKETGKKWYEGKVEPVVQTIARVKGLDPTDVVSAILSLYQAGLVALWPSSDRPRKLAITKTLLA
ncbi:Transcriptional regulator, TetR family [Saccharolobus shibatae B12]|uniref:Transcriptional regulator, TetR family n=1 Tax=Saccharolobus shibatae (strain ATCC 51178 / DSM 5389 / JCM 8931 / NBRC 15437 / B12) TaxID=523848 RepID=A0A8F5BKL2_SACSH|nr:helix-turn-helix domain-containing protein [Saccharolobus shibatae]QXJ27110.1 Transcriptional regulator, TetR family [Saccharolobus shibatae B12]QXJ30003.1 Transcriptional regulator, TetR family [Saccharolobus shibatae B12]